jgi:hypothetical protein
MYQMYEAEVDVAADPIDAVRVVRELLAPKANMPVLVDPAGPGGGNPVVRVRLSEAAMLRFLTTWHAQDDIDEFIVGLTEPNLPVALIGTAIPKG